MSICRYTWEVDDIKCLYETKDSRCMEESCKIYKIVQNNRNAKRIKEYRMQIYKLNEEIKKCIEELYD